MAKVDEEAVAAASLFWVDHAGQQVQNLAEKAARQAAAVWDGFTDWYTPDAIAERAAQAAEVSAHGQQTVAQIMAQYMGEVTAIVRGIRRVDVPNINDPSIRNGADPVLVHARTAKAYRLNYAETQSTSDAFSAALQREIELIETDMMLAARQAQDDAMNELEVVHYRRVLHPELSKTGSCGLCIAAATRVYKVGDLLPIHVRCKCLTMPIIEGVDPASRINQDDIEAAYAEIDATTKSQLSNARVQVHEHGEFGPVLTVQGQKFTGPKDLADKGSGSGSSAGGNGGDHPDGAPTQFPQDDGSQRLPADKSVVFSGPRDRTKSTTSVQTYADLDTKGLIAPDEAPDRHYDANEVKVADWLQARGLKARSVKDLKKKPRTPDTVLDGFFVTAEFKSLLTSGESGAVMQAIRSARGQSRRIVIDGRPQNLGADVAAVGIQRALGKYAHDIDEVIVILGDGTSVGWWHGQR